MVLFKNSFTRVTFAIATIITLSVLLNNLVFTKFPKTFLIKEPQVSEVIKINKKDVNTPNLFKESSDPFYRAPEDGLTFEENIYERVSRSGNNFSHNGSDQEIESNSHYSDLISQTPSLSLQIIDSSNPITQNQISTDVEPHLVLISEVSDSIRLVNPERTMIHESATNDMIQLSQAADNDGAGFFIRSAYRSIEDQQRAYSQAFDKSTVTLPGYSQHHTGLAVDFTSMEIGNLVDKNLHFEDTKAGKWLFDNAWKYGFVLTYTNNYDGIANESWHYLYVGKEFAAELHSLRQNDPSIDYFKLVEMISQGK